MEEQIREPYSIRRFDTFVDGVSNTLLIAVMDNAEFIGSVELDRQGRRCSFFRQLYVAPEWRRRGVGSRLVEKCCEVAREDRGVESIAIIVLETEGLLTFYSQLGFIITFEFEEGKLCLCRTLKDEETRKEMP